MTFKPARRPDLRVKKPARYERSAELVSEIKAMMPRAADSQRYDFLLAIEEEIATHQSLAPRYEAIVSVGPQLEELEAGAKAFAAAVKALEPETRQYLRLGFGWDAREAGAPDIVGAAKASTVDLIQSAEIAHKTAVTATRLLRGMKNKPVPNHLLDELVINVAYAYGSAFGFRATPTKTGPFASLLRLILKVAKIKKPIGEDRLKKILGASKLPGKKRRAGRPSKRN